MLGTLLAFVVSLTIIALFALFAQERCWFMAVLSAFLRLLGRFFRSCEYLMTTMRWNLTMTPTRLDRWRYAFVVSGSPTEPQMVDGGGPIRPKDLCKHNKNLANDHTGHRD